MCFFVLMRKKLLLNLLLTLVLSLLATAFVFFLWYKAARMGEEEAQATGLLFIVLGLGQHLVMLVLVLPILFQINLSNYNKKRSKWIYVFGSPLLATICSLFFYMRGMEELLVAFFIAPITFTVIHYLFYRKLAESMG
jgi:hypothetical protein